MNYNTKYLAFHDLIGFIAQARIKSISRKREFSNIGMIIDVTKNMIITKKNGNVKKYIKKDHVFKIILPEEEINKDEKKYLEIKRKSVIVVLIWISRLRREMRKRNLIKPLVALLI